MGRTSRRKKHTHVALEDDGGAGTKGVAKTFVMERGKVGRLLSQLVLDLRQVMEPYTASKLKVRQRNVLKDFVHVAGPLGVTHFIIVSRTEQFINLKVCRLPRGPTLTFHITAFCLSREVVSSLKKPLVVPHQFQTPPMLIMNNFPVEDKPSKLLSTVFQNMFPSINVQTVKLSNIKRCVLLHNNTDSNTVELRHYAIRVQPRGMSKSVKTLASSHVPNLGRYQDISEYVLRGQGSDSDGEELGDEGKVILPSSSSLPGCRNVSTQQGVIKLSELGPRLTLQLVKVEAGLCGGEVLHHAFVQKSKREQKILRKKIEDAKRQRAERRRQQEANVARKRKERDLHRQRCAEGVAKSVGRDNDEAESDINDDDDDIEWYRQELGEDPDPGSGAGVSKSRLAGSKRQRKTNSSSLFGTKKQRIVPDTSERRGILKKRTVDPSTGGEGGRGRTEATSTTDKKHFRKKKVVKFVVKRKRIRKGKQFSGSAGSGAKRRSGGLAFRRKAKTS